MIPIKITRKKDTNETLKLRKNLQLASKKITLSKLSKHEDVKPGQNYEVSRVKGNLNL